MYSGLQKVRSGMVVFEFVKANGSPTCCGLGFALSEMHVGEYKCKRMCILARNQNLSDCPGLIVMAALGVVHGSQTLNIVAGQCGLISQYIREVVE